MRSLAALLVVLLVVSSVAGVGASRSAEDRAVAPHTSSESASALSATNATQANTTVNDTTEMYVSLRENGDARWTVTQRYVLHDDQEAESFRQLAKKYENGDTNVGPTRATFQRVVERVNADSDRRMELQRVSRSAQVRNNETVGIVSLSFTWTNFTQVSESQIALGDAFWIGSETWLPALSEDQTLVISVPDNYYISGASPSGGVISNGTVLRYEGPQQFQRGDFRVTYSPKSTENSTIPPWFPDISSTWGLLVVFLLFGGGFGAYALSQRRGADPEPVADTDDRTQSPPTVSATADDGDEPSSESHEDEGPSMELLSDEERVLHLLEENDGRMKQGQIVTETNWSNAKVSQLLSKMDENDDVDKLRIGRENLITLPDEDVADVE
ncbi:hypothetical protein [Halorussus sp. MSC15.2]|uniref:helix-turn-helix transcriptional regulator n=1 Tax=Halorussus sp. MSC15.2 TaxID=2283638 RepID=UPI0013D21D14|nr:hypothetical protein [Halorussus sp. MSC15.2]NEU58479.1 hypothetical protein [Halorussus sp. MSC15.2]